MRIRVNSDCDVTMLTFGGAQTFKALSSPAFGGKSELPFDRLVAKTSLWTIATSGLNAYVFPTAEVTVLDDVEKVLPLGPERQCPLCEKTMQLRADGRFPDHGCSIKMQIERPRHEPCVGCRGGDGPCCPHGCCGHTKQGDPWQDYRY